jgi:hypothetical protein
VCSQVSCIARMCGLEIPVGWRLRNLHGIDELVGLTGAFAPYADHPASSGDPALDGGGLAATDGRDIAPHMRCEAEVVIKTVGVVLCHGRLARANV